MATDNELREHSIGELMSKLASDMSLLVRKELELARAEMVERLELARNEAAQTLTAAREETSQKLDLAREDFSRKGKKAGVGLGMLGAAGAATLLALGALSAFLILLLNRALPADVSALIVALIWAVVAVVAGLQGREKVQEVGSIEPGRYVPTESIGRVKDDLKTVPETVVPDQTIETVKEDVEWAKTQMRSDRR